MKYGMFKRAVIWALLAGAILATAACGGTSTEEQGNTTSSEPETVIKTVQSEPETAVEEKTVQASEDQNSGSQSDSGDQGSQSSSGGNSGAASGGDLSQQQAPEEILARQYEHVNEGDYRAAYELFADQSQQKVSFQQYRSFFEDYSFFRVEDYSFPSVNVGEESAAVEVTSTDVTPEGENRIQDTQRMVLENGSWRIIMRDDQIEAFTESEQAGGERSSTPPSESSGEAPDQGTIPGDGTFLVGEDIQPGTYQTAGDEFCYWERLSGTSGSFNDIITNGNATGQTTVTIASSDAAFKTSGCPEWNLRSESASGGGSGDVSSGDSGAAPEESESASGESPDQGTIPGDGTFLVGEDIQPGTYRTAGSEFCYWERLSGTSGSFNDIITNGNATGQTTVTISPSDAAFKTSGCPLWELR